MSAAQALQDDSLLIVDVSRGKEGVAFALYPLSGEYLRQVAPGARQWPRVFIERETKADFQQLEASLLQHIAQMLTGMSLDRLRQLGLRLEFVDVHSDEVLGRVDPAGAPASRSTTDSSTV